MCCGTALLLLPPGSF
ncbi:hypothetical protein LINPERHAP2_LOCUS9889 [Linum perenne]